MLKNIPFYASLLEKDGATFGLVLVYGAIEAHSFGERGCIASNKTIAKECGLKEATVAKTISLLNKMGWVKVELDENNHRKLIAPLLIIATPLPHSKPPFTVQKTPLYSTVNIDNSIENTVIDTITNVIEAKPTKPVKVRGYTSGNQDINDCLNKWNEIIGYPITSNAQRNRYAINNLLKKHSKLEIYALLEVIREMKLDKYAPRVADFVELQSRLNAVLAWIHSQNNNDGGVLSL